MTDPLSTGAEDCSVVELRQYTLRPGKRAVLIDLFDREFIESQEIQGMHLFGQFRDLIDPDRFVWVRGFADMESRAKALAGFYYGPVWQAHREVANGTMIDSDNVLLLRSTTRDSGFPAPAAARPVANAGVRPSSRALLTTYHPTGPIDEFARFFAQQAVPVLAATGGRPIAIYQTEHAENTFPALPVRAGETVFVWFSFFATEGQYEKHRDRLARSARWTEEVGPELLARLKNPADQRLLEPTSRSHLR